MIWRNQNGNWREAPLYGSCEGLAGFIVCNGPSLEQVDTSRLSGPGRVVIGVNNVIPQIRPDWWVGMDHPDCYDASLVAQPHPKLISKFYQKDWDGVPNVFVPDCTTNIPFYDGEEKDMFRWDGDSFRIALQFAMHLGCRRIVLVGVDLDNSKGDYAGGNILSDKQRAINQRLYDQTFCAIQRLIRKNSEVSLFCTSQQSRLAKLIPVLEIGNVITEMEAETPKGRSVNHNTDLGTPEAPDKKILLPPQIQL